MDLYRRGVYCDECACDTNHTGDEHRAAEDDDECESCREAEEDPNW